MHLIVLNTETVYATGDLHGLFNTIPWYIKHCDIKNCVIFFCGDFGLGFHSSEFYKNTFTKLCKELEKRNIYILAFRGNHDNPDYFNSELYKAGRIMTLYDYSVVQIFGKDDKFCAGEHMTALVVGGGLSIDRRDRLSRMKQREIVYARYHHNKTKEEISKMLPCEYWENEMPVFDINALEEIENEGIRIDTVLTHSAPDFCQPISKDGIQYWIKNDEQLSIDADTERQTLTKVYNWLDEHKHPLEQWCYGHYHFHNTENINGVTFKLLDMAGEMSMDMIPIKYF